MDQNISPSPSLESPFFHLACQANSYTRGRGVQCVTTRDNASPSGVSAAKC